MTTTTIKRSYRKNPHTARFLMAFHAGTNGLASDIEETTVEEDLLDTIPEGPVDLRTEAQVNFMDRLIEQIAALDPETGRKAARYTDGMTESGQWTPGRTGNASAWIDRMLAKVAELKAASKPAAPVELEDGIYLLGEDIVKVVHAIHGSGRQYGKKLVAPEAEGENGSWVMVPGVVAKLTPEMKMDLAQAEKFGAIYGCCVRCGRGLTKETSIAQAMGDKCAGKF